MKLKTLVSLLAAAFAAPAVLASSSGVVISQVYGGGGNSGATIKNAGFDASACVAKRDQFRYAFLPNDTDCPVQRGN